MSPHLNAACLAGKATNTNVIVFGWNQTRGKHANHYTTNAVKKKPLYLQQINCIYNFSPDVQHTSHQFLLTVYNKKMANVILNLLFHAFSPYPEIIWYFVRPMKRVAMSSS